MSEQRLRPLPPLQLVHAQADTGSGVIAEDRDGIGLALVMARRGEADALAALVQARFGLELPAGPARARQGDVAFAGIGPGTWLASSEGAGNRFATSLRTMLRGVASVTDQSDGHAVLRLGGAAAHTVLSRLVPVDLHPARFGRDAVAVTVLSHIGVTLWQAEDDQDGRARYELAFYRSYTESLWHALAEAASEVGLAIASSST